MFYVATDFPHSTFLDLPSTSLVPALGEIWSHCITNRILLYWDLPTNGTGAGEGMLTSEGMERVAEIVKSPCWPLGKASFAVCSSGVRDVHSTQVRQDPSSALHKRAAPFPASAPVDAYQHPSSTAPTLGTDGRAANRPRVQY